MIRPEQGNRGQLVATRDTVVPTEGLEVPVPAQALAEDMLRTYGHVVGGEALHRLLGYATPDAFQQALRRDAIGVPVFSLPGRRGKFALTRDISAFLIRHRAHAIDQHEGGHPAR